MSSHTPGPWHTDSTCGGLAIESAKHGNIGLVNLARASQADARLIAAAPDLLAALETINAYWLSYWPEGPNQKTSGERIAVMSDATANIWRQIQAAIRAAKVGV